MQTYYYSRRSITWATSSKRLLRTNVWMQHFQLSK
ncbi:hypothetical protein BVRB_4g089640 [Beta vulgaris subsp. vulgaris]|nr:hypothetical protein BVRB_4g089640 [Beta vulgaris subsp. vulgaris]